MKRIAIAVAVLSALACGSKKKQPGPYDKIPTRTTLGGAGTSADVNVLFDSQGVPTILAKTDADAMFAFGWVQAHDRFAEMDLYRRYARGRLSELLGGVTESTDIYFRTIFTTPDGKRIEDAIADQLTPDLKSELQRYADGVNRWIADVKAGKEPLPDEYKGIGVSKDQLADWDIRDTLAIGRLQSYALSSSLDDELNAARFAGAAASRPDIVADLTRSAPAVDSFILVFRPGARPQPWMPSKALTARLASLEPNVQGALDFMAHAQLPFVPPGEKAGSNNWVVGPTRTADGHAMVSNDPHLGLGYPSTLWMVHVKTDAGLDVGGVSFPGIPVVVIGHNNQVAWGDTVVGYDVTDVYGELLSADGKQVMQKGAMVNLLQADASYQILQGGQLVTKPLTIPVVPGHGPLLPGSVNGTKALSVKWTGQTPTNEALAFWGLDHAGTVDEAIEALRNFRVGAQNFVIGDTAGHIAYFPHADVPIRANDDRTLLAQNPPWLPMPGDDPNDAYAWTGMIADADLPQAKDPSSAYIATANNDQVGNTQDNNPLNDPHYLYYTDDLGFRHAEIVKDIKAKQGLTMDDLTKIQADTHSLFAETVMPGLLGALNNYPQDIAGKGLTQAVNLLTNWDFSTPTGLDGTDPATSPLVTDSTVLANSAASTIFHAFVGRFLHHVLDDDLAPFNYTYKNLPFDQLTIKYMVALLTDPSKLATQATLCDDATTSGTVEDCGQMAIAALDDTVKFLTQKYGTGDATQWAWGKLHHVQFTWALDQLDPSIDDVPHANDGGLFTVDVANFDIGNDDYYQGDGPNVRITTELDPSHVRWRAVIPGGEVDRKGDPHRLDQVDDWLSNAPGDRAWTTDEVIAAAKEKMVFKP